MKSTYKKVVTPIISSALILLISISIISGGLFFINNANASKVQKVTTSGSTITYLYDESGNRIMKNEGGKKTYYVNDYYEEDSDGKAKKYIYANGVKVATIGSSTGSSIGSSTAFNHADHLGGSNISTDSSGKVVEVNDYYPFGSSRIEEKAKNYTNNYLYTGKELDKNTNLYYYGARYYDPLIGRFTSVDPWQGDLANPQTLNKYSYVYNNPMKYVDPNGMWGIAPVLGGASHQAITNMGINSSKYEIGTADRALLTYAASFWADVGVYMKNKIPYLSGESKKAHHHSTSSGQSMTALQIKTAMIEDAHKWYTSGSKLDFGRLLHMVQDSYSPGHVARDNEGNIKAFLDASKQQYWDYHRENDNYLDANNKIKPEAKEAGSATAKLIDYYYDNAEWEKVKTYLDTEVFKGVDKNTKVGIPKLESSDNN